MIVAQVLWVLTILLPINGLIWLGMRAERKRLRNLAISLNRMRKRLK